MSRIIIFAVCLSIVLGQVEFVKELDIDRFMGVWYAIASKPNLIEKNCRCAHTTDTRQKTNQIELAETCMMFGRWITSKSKAIIDEPNTGHWTNVQSSIIRADYWVIDIAQDYSWSVIGQPSYKGYWIMSRERTLDQNIVNHLIQKAISLGYDLSDIEYAEQDCYDN